MNENRSNPFNAGKSLDAASAACRDIGDMDGVLAYADQETRFFIFENFVFIYKTLVRY